MEQFENFINGEWVSPSSQEYFEVTDPAHPETVVSRFPSSSTDDVYEAIMAALDAQTEWAMTPPPSRGTILNRAAEILREQSEELTQYLVMEEGKTHREAAGEVSRAIDIFSYYAQKARDLGGVRRSTSQRNRWIQTRSTPLGVVALITPWNYPIAIPAWKLAPALAAGNTVILKPASEAPRMAASLIEALSKAGLPDGVVNLVTGAGSIIGPALTGDERIDGISFTGSTDVGTAVARQAADRLARVQCEMGGKNPTVVMPSADISDAVGIVAGGGFGTTGQSCTACSRALVHREIYDEFVEALIEHAEGMQVGPGLENPDMGPQVSAAELEGTLGYVHRAADMGAVVRTGGQRLRVDSAPEGHFIAPTVVTDVTPTMEIARQEIFGPVVTVMPIADIDEAIDLSNDTEYGLSASIVTRVLSEAHSYADGVEAGIVKVNEKTTGVELHAPFGGVKASSSNTYREQGDAALEFFSVSKTIYMNY